MIILNAADSNPTGRKRRNTKPKRKHTDLQPHDEIKPAKRKNKGGEDSGGRRENADHLRPSAPEKNNKKSKEKEKVISDERFASANTDPRFRSMPKKWSKVQVDKRFAKMFTDKHFTASSAPVDKRGRAKKGSSTEANTLQQYYQHDMEERAPGSDKDDDDENMGDTGIETSSSSDSDTETSSSNEDAKGIEDEDDDDKLSVNSDIGHYLMANHKDTPTSELDTNRLAVVNMDWNYIRASDLYVVMTSFLPKGGHILSVAIYPSEFGLQRMQHESVHGPTWVFDDNEESSGDESTEISNEKRRSYELSKLRALDGTELLSTSNVFDLRFIPDSMEFKHPHRDIATEAPTKYTEPNFETRALQRTEVELTWDEDVPERKKLLRRDFDLDEINELEKYLASTDEESDDSCSTEAAREKWRALLGSGNASDADDSDDKDKEMTFHDGLEDLSKRILEKKDRGSETVLDVSLRRRREKKAARKKRGTYSSDDDNSDYNAEMPDPDQPDEFFESHVSKKSVKDSSKGKGRSRKRKNEPSPDNVKEQEASRAELDLLFLDTEVTGEGPKGYNLKPKRSKGKKKGKKEPLDEDKLPNVDVSNDPRFSALFSSHHFALDPTDPQYKRSATYARERHKNQKAGNTKKVSDEQTQQG